MMPLAPSRTSVLRLPTERLARLLERRRALSLPLLRRSEPGMFFFVATLVTLVGWARLPWTARKVVWAEDGTIFLTQLEGQGFLPTLFKPYAGYLQFWPRVLSWIATAGGDLRIYADLIALLACAAVGLLSAGVFFWSRTVVADVRFRIALALVPVLVPMAPMEVLGNVANLHWFTILPCALLLLYGPRTMTGAILLGLLGSTLALTEIQVAVLAPLFVVGPWTLKRLVVRGGVVLGLVGQGIATLSEPRPGIVGHLNLESIVAGYFVNGPYEAIVGDEGTAGRLLAAFGLPLAALAAVPFAFCAFYAIRHGSRQVRLLTVALLLASVGLWCAAVWMNVSAAIAPYFDYAHFPSERFRTISFFRYGFVPQIALLVIVVLALVARRDRVARTEVGSASSSRIRSLSDLLPVVFAVGLGLLLVVEFTIAGTLRSGGPLWKSGVEDAAASCAADPGRTEVQVGEAPSGWVSTLPCSALRTPRS